MTSEYPPLKTHQFYKASLNILGIPALTKLHGISSRQLYRWAADPAFTNPEDHERNPLDRLQVQLSRLCEIGREDAARAAVAMLAETVGCELACSDDVRPDKGSVEAECLDDHPALVKFHEAIRNRESPEVIRFLWMEIKQEVNETYMKAVNSRKERG